MKLCTSMAAVLVMGALGLGTAQAADLWWDRETPGSTTDPGLCPVAAYCDGVWDAAAVQWNTDATGGAGGATQAWNDAAAPLDAAHFAVDGFGSAIEPDALVEVLASNIRNAASMTVENGWVALSGTGTINLSGAGGAGLELKAGTTLSGYAVNMDIPTFLGGHINLGANPITIRPGATLAVILDTASTTNTPLTIVAGQQLILDGGTYNNRHFAISTNVRTFYPNPGAVLTNQIMLTTNGGTLDGTNIGTDTNYSIMSWTGTIGLTPGTTTATLTIKGRDELRMRGVNAQTTLDVQGGLLRVDGTGGTEQTLGNPNGTVKVHGGAVPNSSKGSALGTTFGMTAANASPATRSFELLADNPLLPDSMFVLNASWTILGNISGTGGLMLNGWAREDGGPALQPQIGSQAQTLRLGGTNTYAGDTTINYGNITVQGGNAIPDTSDVIFSTTSDWGGHGGATPVVLNTAIFRLEANETVPRILGGNASRGSVEINLASTLTVGDGTDFTYSGNVTQTNGTGSLTKVGAGIMTMENFDWGITGGVTVSQGTLKFGNPAAGFANTNPVTVSAGATLDMNDINDTFGSLSGSGTVARGPSANITFAGTAAAGTKTFSGTMTGDGNLTKGRALPNGNVDTGIQVLASANTYGDVTVNAGTLRSNAVTTTTGAVTVNGTSAVSGGTLGGTGSVTGAVTVNAFGRIAPGASAGVFSAGSATFQADSFLDIELGGTTFGSYDQFALSSPSIVNGGTVKLSYISGYAPAVDDTFHILHTSGTGLTVNTPFLLDVTSVTTPVDTAWQLTPLATSYELKLVATAQPLFGDYTNDGIVDARDFVMWAKLNPNGASGLPFNDETPTTIGTDDYDTWKEHFGEPPAGSGGGNGGTGAVPEPTTIAMLLMGVAAVALRRRSR